MRKAMKNLLKEEKTSENSNAFSASAGVGGYKVLYMRPLRAHLCAFRAHEHWYPLVFRDEDAASVPGRTVRVARDQFGAKKNQDQKVFLRDLCDRCAVRIFVLVGLYEQGAQVRY